MKYMYENDQTLRISLTFKDLREHEIRAIDFLTEQEKVEALFFELVDELDLDERWDNSELMTFQIRPHRDGIDLLVSDNFEGLEISKTEMADELEQFMNSISSGGEEISEVSSSEKKEKSSDAKKEQTPKEEKPLPDYIYYTVKFADFSDIIRLAKTVNLEMEESELYSLDGSYYLTILDNQKKKGKRRTMILRSLMLEYGEQASLSRDQLREHAKIVLDANALLTLKKI